MGGSISDTSQQQRAVASIVMENLYDLSSQCISKTTQSQNIITNTSGNLLMGNINQSQNSSKDLSCLSNNKLSQQFNNDFKNTLKQNLENQVSQVGSFAVTSNKVYSDIANNLYTTNQIKSIQSVIDNLAQSQNVIGNTMGNATYGNISQSQAAEQITKQIGDVVNTAISQASQSQEMDVAQKTVVTGIDVTSIATTAIKTVGSVLTTFANTLMYGAIIFVLVIIAVIIGVIIFIKNNCINIKTGLNQLSKKLPVPTFQIKIITGALGLLCPGDK